MSNDEELIASVLARMRNGTNNTQVAVSKAQVAVSKPVSRDDTEGKKFARTRTEQPKFQFPAEPRVIQIIHKPKTYMDHSYRDFSSVPPELDYVEPTSIQDMTFSQKVHHMLSHEEYSKWICWCPHGRAFRAIVPKRLEKDKVLSQYFDHNRYSSFLRQLNNFGFKHVSEGRDQNCYYHEVSRSSGVLDRRAFSMFMIQHQLTLYAPMPTAAHDSWSPTPLQVHAPIQECAPPLS
jgi:hypothetical protein